MKRSFLIKVITAILIIFIFGLSAFGCKRQDKDNNDDGINGDNSIGDGGNINDDNNVNDGNNVSDNDPADDISAVEGATELFIMVSGDSVEIALADYVNTNGLEGVTYNIEADNDSVILSSVVDGIFTATAGNVSEVTNATVSITVCHEGAEKLTVELSFKITDKGGIVPDDNIDNDW